MGAGLIGGLIGVVGSIIGGSESANATSNAANSAAAVQWKIFQQEQKNMQPWLAAGKSALTNQAYLLGTGPAPSYQFQEGTGKNAKTISQATDTAPTYYSWTTGGKTHYSNDPMYSYGKANALKYSDTPMYQYQEGKKTIWSSSDTAPTYTTGTGKNKQTHTATLIGHSNPLTAQTATATGSNIPNGLTAAQYGEYSKPFTQEQMYQDPGYKFALQQGVNALTASGAASGMYGSGNMGTALTNYGQQMGSQEYQNAYNRWMDIYNRYAGLANTGQVQSQNMANLGMNAANGLANTYMTAGNSLSNIYGNMWQGLSNNMMSGYGTYLNQQNQNNLMSMMGGIGYGNNYANGYFGMGDTYAGMVGSVGNYMY